MMTGVSFGGSWRLCHQSCVWSSSWLVFLSDMTLQWYGYQKS